MPFGDASPGPRVSSQSENSHTIPLNTGRRVMNWTSSGHQYCLNRKLMRWYIIDIEAFQWGSIAGVHEILMLNLKEKTKSITTAHLRKITTIKYSASNISLCQVYHDLTPHPTTSNSTGTKLHARMAMPLYTNTLVRTGNKSQNLGDIDYWFFL